MQNMIFTIISFYMLAAFFVLAVFLIYKKPHLWHYMLAAFLGLLTGYIDAHSSEVHLSVLLLLSFGFFLGFSKPEKPWLMILLLALWVPVFAFAKIVLTGAGNTIIAEGVGSFLCFIPATIGVYIGKAIHSAISRGKPAVHDASR
ncbi:MAG TPA: hypothetical protein VFA55_02835 [Candidatus Kapabacteria bacterium]|nr:hypothetical protein [Candidatus Kapabacteria bacterium]